MKTFRVFMLGVDFFGVKRLRPTVVTNAPTRLDPLSPFHLKMEVVPAFEVLWLFLPEIMTTLNKSDHTVSSYPFKIQFRHRLSSLSHVPTSIFSNLGQCAWLAHVVTFPPKFCRIAHMVSGYVFVSPTKWTYSQFFCTTSLYYCKL